MYTERKPCSKCNQWKLGAEYHKGYKFCKACDRVYQRDRTFNLKPGAWDALFDSQGACCAICHATEPSSKKGWATDHSHAHGNIRGILCPACNRALGALGDELAPIRELVPRILRYLERAEACAHEIAAQSGYCIICIGKPI